MRTLLLAGTLAAAVATVALSTPPARAGDSGTAFVPEAWREKARNLVEPGVDGLTLGLKLKELELNPLTATYEGPPGRLVVVFHPPGEGPGSKREAWAGQRLSATVLDTTLAEDDYGKAMKTLTDRLRDRETGWGWLRKAVPDEVVQQRREESLAELAAARRALALGEPAAAEAHLAKAPGPGPVDLDIQRETTRLWLRAGVPDRAREAANALKAIVAKAIEANPKRGGPMATRLEGAAASAAALAGDIRSARLNADALLGTNLACRTIPPVAADLRLAGHDGTATALLEALVRKVPRCGEAHRELVEGALARGDSAAADKALATALEAAGDRAEVRYAEALAAAWKGDLDTARRAARVALETGRIPAGTMDLLALVEVVLHHERPELAKEPLPDQEHRAQRVAVCVGRGATACVAEDVAVALKEHPGAPGLLAAKAWALRREGKEPAAELAAVWRAEPPSILAAWAERGTPPGHLIGRRLGPELARRVTAVATAPPVAEAEPAVPPEPTPAPPAEPDDSPTRWWPMVAGVALLGGLWLAVRARRTRDG